jgi:DNA-binding FrmR family transcriptional regulator
MNADDMSEWQRRTEGQIRDVIRPIEEGRDGAGVVTQSVRLSRALGRALFTITASGLRRCITGAGTATQNREQREKLFLPLA